MSTRIPWPTARRAVPMAAVVLPLPGPVLTMISPRRISSIAELLIVQNWNPLRFVEPKPRTDRIRLHVGPCPEHPGGQHDPRHRFHRPPTYVQCVVARRIEDHDAPGTVGRRHPRHIATG